MHVAQCETYILIIFGHTYSLTNILQRSNSGVTTSRLKFKFIIFGLVAVLDTTVFEQTPD